MLAVEDIGDDPIALATRGKHCLNEIISFLSSFPPPLLFIFFYSLHISLFSHLFTQFENMDKLGGDTQSLEEAKNISFIQLTTRSSTQSQHHAASRSITQHHAASRSITQHHAASRSITQHHAASSSITQHHPFII